MVLEALLISIAQGRHATLLGQRPPSGMSVMSARLRAMDRRFAVCSLQAPPSLAPIRVVAKRRFAGTMGGRLVGSARLARGARARLRARLIARGGGGGSCVGRLCSLLKSSDMAARQT